MTSVAVYATREDVKASLNFMDTARADQLIDEAIEGASRSIDGECKRVFWPQLDTRTFDWPNDQYARSWRLWLNQNELAGPPTAVISGGVDITANIFARPDWGPPFRYLEVNLAGQQAFSSSATWQRSIAVTGPFGYRLDENAAGSLAASIGDFTTTSVSLTNGAVVGVGSILRVDTERFRVTDMGWLSTAQTSQGGLTAQGNNVLLAVTDGTKFTKGETLLIDAEQMVIVAVAGNTLTVKRSWNGTVLAVHNAGATIYAARLATVERGAYGTTASTHANGTPAVTHAVPGLIRSWCKAEALATLLAEQQGYAAQIIRKRQLPGDVADPAPALDSIRQRGITAYARKMRIRSV